jgi:hypothetical protein
VRGFARTFGTPAPNGGFGVWWLFPPNPALAGNACRWALSFPIYGEKMNSSDSRLSRINIIRILPIWILIHSIGGIAGYGVGSIFQLLGIPYSTIVSIVVLELILFILKAWYYKGKNNLLCIRGIDNFAWTLSGIFFIIINLVETNAENIESFTPSLRLPEFSGFIILAICIISFVFGIIPITKIKSFVDNSRMEIIKSFIRIILLSPLIFFTILIIFSISCIILGIFALTTFAIVVSPIEIFFYTYQYSDIFLIRIIFGLVSTTWVGIVTGVAFLIAYPHLLEIYEKRDMYFWPKNMPF